MYGLGTIDGNTFTTNHTTLSTDSAAFWDFTYDDMALQDLPAHINYVLDHTGVETLAYIGHSQGTIQAFAGFSSLPELAKKINLFVGMAPVAYVHHQRGWALNIIADLDVDKLFQALGVEVLTKGLISKFALAMQRPARYLQRRHRVDRWPCNKYKCIAH